MAIRLLYILSWIITIMLLVKTINYYITPMPVWTVDLPWEVFTLISAMVTYGIDKLIKEEEE